jgi:hypothetical protein
MARLLPRGREGFAGPRHGVNVLAMLQRFARGMRIPARIADDAHHLIDLARGSLSGDPYDATATQAYGQIIESIRGPWGRGLPSDREITLGISIGRHMVADTCLVYAAAQVIAAEARMDMAEALRVLDAAIDDMAAGRPVTPAGDRAHTSHGHRSQHDWHKPLRGRGREAQAFRTTDRRHSGRKTKTPSGHGTLMV